MIRENRHKIEFVFIFDWQSINKLHSATCRTILGKTQKCIWILLGCLLLVPWINWRTLFISHGKCLECSRIGFTRNELLSAFKLVSLLKVILDKIINANEKMIYYKNWKFWNPWYDPRYVSPETEFTGEILFCKIEFTNVRSTSSSRNKLLSPLSFIVGTKKTNKKEKKKNLHKNLSLPPPPPPTFVVLYPLFLNRGYNTWWTYLFDFIRPSRHDGEWSVYQKFYRFHESGVT